ncbi:GntR family transcriptional regulator [Litoreibacter ponti]|uniref:GntR family transcriptional regulator n=1 Tax=Litoreibacter ponti TaxID=1510457 RepID=A0A2T6BHE9_9RHOB|nr:GntR family transcriptional regulator [Litoreibacter ponti]PTX55479.1 GntR family transcriptional regulator [Litoreibacter ponti]
MESIKPQKSLVEQVYDILLDAICSGEIPPGERLNQDEIATRLNVSRQPVNSAISILKANGFVRDNGRRGGVVSEVDMEQYRSIYEFRGVVEPFAAKRAAERIGDDAASEARDILREGSAAIEARDIKRLLKADVRFHQTIYRWSGNHVIEDSMRANWPHMLRSMTEILRDPDSARQSWDDHKDIMEALLARDGPAAEAAMKRHIGLAFEKTRKVLVPRRGGEPSPEIVRSGT